MNRLSTLLPQAILREVWYHANTISSSGRGRATSMPQNVKGMRDHLPEAMILRQYIINTLTGVFERHGFEPLQTPIIEYAETLEGKIGDEEKLIYRFETHGGDKVALRYD